MKEISIFSRLENYSVHIENNLFDHLSQFLDVFANYVIVVDDNIPKVYLDKVIAACPNHLVIAFPEGERSKCFEEYRRILEIMIENNVRKDAILIALGGGVTGDLAGFVASTYLRGISYVQIPTSLLAQIDSSVGGKVALDFHNAKNSVGSIYPPKKVLIDPLSLNTLEARHLRNGMAELIKYGMIADKSLFDSILEKDIFSNLENLITRAIEIKKSFVEADEFDNGSRHALNFGHTYGHAIEAYYRYEKYLHGEAIAIGMVRMLPDGETKSRLVSALMKYSLPIEDPVSNQSLQPYLSKDKKNRSGLIRVVNVPKIGTYEIKNIQLDTLWK